MKKNVCIILVLFLIMTTFIGCRKGNKKESGDFIYDIIYYNEKDVPVVKEKGIRSCVRILALSEVGKEKEIIICLS